ncbi:Ion transport 2 [Cynara cardunculus var. scolymus]|uniref:Ion transport 2 n=1 Tax=Cynara cardunculus var. scolymus TaxID=59895 RepID=A0A103XPH4_CYNCS|nr:Ion transport 2 [Cynara cardunculus var. scolymus]
MEAEPFRPSRRTKNLVDDGPTSSDSSSPEQQQEVQDLLHNSHQDSSFNPPLFLFRNNSNSNSKKQRFYRCKTAPAMVVMPQEKSTDPKPAQADSASLLRQAALLLILYLSLGVFIYYFNRDHFSGLETHPLVDALYFCIVTMCTIGYGDIAPVTPSAKLFSCFFVLVGFGFIDIMLSGVVNYVLDLQENMVLKSIRMNHAGLYMVNNKGLEETRFSPIDYIFDFAKGRMRIRLKVGLALGVVLLSIGMGTVVLFFVEGLDWIDSLYLSVLSVTTVGYGDKAFETLPGRLFASIWLLFSTLMVARSFLYLTEARIDKRHRRLANCVLHRQITVKDLLAADINNNGFLWFVFFLLSLFHVQPSSLI